MEPPFATSRLPRVPSVPPAISSVDPVSWTLPAWAPPLPPLPWISTVELLMQTTFELVGTPLSQLPAVYQLPPEAPVQVSVHVAAWAATGLSANTAIATMSPANTARPDPRTAPIRPSFVDDCLGGNTLTPEATVTKSARCITMSV